MRLNQLLKISDAAVEFLNKYIKPVVTPDYIGWSVPLPKKYKSVIIVDYSVDKSWDLIPINIKKKFKKRTIKKALKFLINKGWLTPLSSVFEEFSPQLEANMDEAIVIPREDYINTDKVAEIIPYADMVYDDDISGIYIEDNENS